MQGIPLGVKIFIAVWAFAFITILSLVVTMIVRHLKAEADNKKQPIETADVTVVTKRIRVSGDHSHTTYFVTFEDAASARREYQVEGELYGLLVEGDSGRLTSQGYKVIEFRRY